MPDWKGERFLPNQAAVSDWSAGGMIGPLDKLLVTAAPFAGLFEWSIKNQDTETPADPAQRRQITEQDRKW